MPKVFSFVFVCNPFSMSLADNVALGVARGIALAIIEDAVVASRTVVLGAVLVVVLGILVG